MSRLFHRIVFGGIGALLLGASAFAQPSAGRPLIGVLVPGRVPSAETNAFLQALGDLGERAKIRAVFRAAGFHPARLPALAKQLVRLHADLLVTASYEGVLAAARASRTLPIVFAALNDPVALGFAQSLAHPGGNITGIAVTSPGITARRLALLKEALPAAARIAILEATSRSPPVDLQDVVAAADGLGLDPRFFEAAHAEQFEEIAAAMRAWSADAVLVLEDGVFQDHARSLAIAAARRGLPLVCPALAMAAAGCLLAYGPELSENYRQAAALAAKILHGARPAELPIAYPARLETHVNRKAAAALGVSLPRALLARAERVLD